MILQWVWILLYTNTDIFSTRLNAPYPQPPTEMERPIVKNSAGGKKSISAALVDISRLVVMEKSAMSGRRAGEKYWKKKRKNYFFFPLAAGRVPHRAAQRGQLLGTTSLTNPARIINTAANFTQPSIPSHWGQRKALSNTSAPVINFLVPWQRAHIPYHPMIITSEYVFWESLKRYLPFVLKNATALQSVRPIKNDLVAGLCWTNGYLHGTETNCIGSSFVLHFWQLSLSLTWNCLIFFCLLLQSSSGRRCALSRENSRKQIFLHFLRLQTWYPAATHFSVLSGISWLQPLLSTS